MASLRALRTRMPELVPTYERLVALVGGSDSVARLLSLWCPSPYLTACSQAVWRGGGAPILVRNYDYQPLLWDCAQLATSWTGRRVIGMSDSLWGLLDGINEDGLVVSLAFGGRKNVGIGFGMPLILRYVLETCRTVEEGVAALLRIPAHMSYNVTLLDKQGAFQTVYLAPDRAPFVANVPYATNHQRHVEWGVFADATATLEREQCLIARLDDPGETADHFVAQFLEPPLYQSSFARGWGTLYTAVYEPQSGVTALHWAGRSLRQSIDAFHDATVTLSYGDAPGCGSNV